MKNDLSIPRLLQRYAAGAGGGHLLEGALREETQRLAREEGSLESHRQEFRRFARHHLNEFHEGLFGAVSRLGTVDLAGAFEKVRQADAALRELRRFQAAIRDYYEAESAWKRMEAELALSKLTELPTLRIPWRLLDLSLAYLEDGQPLESSVVSRVCSQCLERLTARDGHGGGRSDFRFESFSHSINEVGMTGEVRLAEIGRLAQGGYSEVASRLLDDLEVELLGWRSQLRRGQRSVSILAREIGEVALYAASLQQTFQNWLPDQAAGQKSSLV